MAKQSVKIYVDGSYSPSTKKIGCAVVLFPGANKRPYRIAFCKELKSQHRYGSNIAEMTAVKTAIKTARSFGFAQISIYYDWNGLELFSHLNNIKKRHDSCPYYAVYADCLEKARKNIEISFIKVKAHSNNEFNCLADKMAKAGRAV